MSNSRANALVAVAVALPIAVGAVAFGVVRAGAREPDPIAIVHYQPAPPQPAPATAEPVEVPPATLVTPEPAFTEQPGHDADADYLDQVEDYAEVELAEPVEHLAPAGAQRATVTRVIDGDTIEVVYQGQTERVRLVDIDTPERGAAGFTEATEFTRSAIASAGNEVYLQTSGNNRDRFDRLRRNVWLETENGFVLLNNLLVETGHAQVRILR